MNKTITLQVELPAPLREQAAKAIWYDGAAKGCLAGALLVAVVFVLAGRGRS